MNVEMIGSWAGLVWAALDVAKTLEIKQLRTVTKLKEKEVYVALGWLAREDKVTITVEGKETLITLID
ncbi:MAG: winged helix-turn-helix domain-containing protein [Bacteroidales bacterium]